MGSGQLDFGITGATWSAIPTPRTGTFCSGSVVELPYAVPPAGLTRRPGRKRIATAYPNLVRKDLAAKASRQP
ncbi:hypothetical protein I545_6385 [Mycobacterium kansasii 662]|uniref:Uncharacterized protein n=1 Tax=Mycobacterium kansasii 662 TaxID=1299326 RepID=X7YNC3_MYCKA|nr:hypothetical protein I545_6385 [Mycobacterium kansasii 662]